MKKFYIITFLVVLIDRISKILVDNFLDNKTIDIIKDYFYLTYVKNDGAAFSILTSQRVLLIVISVAAIIFIHYFVDKYKKKSIGYAFLMGGIIGNLMDRVVLGAVIDFIGVIIFNYHFPIFNIADIFIVLGAVFILFEKDVK